eukprot:SAG22_NODE_1465_length_4355_cov_31.402491_4_plen_42_part_00
MSGFNVQQNVELGAPLSSTNSMVQMVTEAAASAEAVEASKA